MLINGTEFNLDFCKSFSAAKLRKIYNGETSDTLDKLIQEVHGDLEVATAKKSKKK